MKAPKFFAIVSLLILTTGSAFGQVPVWTATYPSLSNISALNAVLNVNLTNLPGDVTVYFTVYSILAGDTPAGVKAASGNLPSGAFRGGGSFTYTTGNSGTTISQFFENLFPSKPTNTILITVEYAPNVFLPVKTVVFATPACANLNVATSRFEPVECVNKGVTFTLSIPGVDPDPQISGVYNGTTWDINWGDGTADMLYTSTANSDFPNNALRTHPYPAITSCVYTITLNIQSPAPCSKFFTVKYQVFVHGRDIPGDGDGVLLIQENLTGLTTTIPVCEGSTHTITLKDMSTWNCQNPVLGGLPWPPAKNTSDRTIQWLYGIDNGGVLQNTIGQTLGITPNVVIGGVNNAIRTIQGYTQPVIAPAAYQGELSQTILIPATCRAGEIFNVYLRNWNKCNVYGVDLPVFTQIQIMVVAAPAAPIASDVNLCFTGNPALSVLTASHGVPAGNVLRWYTNADKTGYLNSGLTYSTGISAVGTYTYYVSDGQTSGNLCEGPTTPVVLTISPVIANNTIAAAQTVCSTTLPAGLTGSTPTGGTGVYTYQWQNSADNVTFNNIPGATGIDYAPPVLASTTWYRRIVTSGPCSLTSGSIKITVTPLPVATITYAGSPFCKTLVTGQAVTRTGTAGGSYSALPVGLTIDAVTGAITPSTSTAGIYTVTYTIAAAGGCAIVTATTSVTITTLPVATITYAGSPFCKTLVAGQAVTQTGTAGGAYNALPAGLTIDAVTGAITPSTSTAGIYTVTYTIAAAGGCAIVTATTPVTITALPVATINYAGSPFCKTLVAGQAVTQTGTAGGAYNALPAGLTIDAVTGAITPSTSTAGIYTVSYTIAAAGGCAIVTATTSVTITALPVATITYAGSPFCKTLVTGQAVTRTGTAGGSYSALPAGLTIDAVTGAITPSTSTAGIYTVTYTIAAAGGCAIVTATTPVTITALPVATINYAGSPFCKTLVAGQAVTQTGTAGGAYSALPAGLTIDAVTGAITPNTSTAGIYTVSYTIAAAGGCAIVTTTTPVTITALPTAAISYTGSPWCSSAGVQNVTLVGTTGGAYSAAPAGLTIDAATGAITPGTSTAGAYTVTYTIAAAGGCAVVTTTTNITINAVPTVIITNPAAVCAPAIVNLTAAAVTAGSTGGLNYTYWTDAGTTIALGAPAAVNASGTYYIKGTVLATGCFNIQPVVVAINPAKPAVPTISGVSPVCQSQLGVVYSVPLDASVTNYVWSFDPVLSATLLAPVNQRTITVNFSGTSASGNVRITAQNGCGDNGVSLPYAITVTPLPAATISYVGSPFCRTLGAGQAVTQTGTAGGAYSAAPAGLTISAVTGAINPSTSTAGAYTVTYTIAAGGGCGIVTATTPVTITALPTAAISYTGSPWCTSAGIQNVTLVGTAGGAYTAPAGLTIDAAGAITPGTSTAGIYTVTYSIAAAGGCAIVTATTSVTITALPSATISYAGSPFCKTLGAGQAVTRTGTAGGAYSAAPAGLTIDAVTGAINPGTSTAGVYTVTYTIAAAGGCAIVTTTAAVTITTLPAAIISYAGSPFCKTLVAGQSVTLTGTAGGTYSAAPAGLTIDAVTGAITPSTSTAGAYTVTYTIAAAGGCAVVTATTPVTVTALPTATISYAGTPFCKTLGAGQAVTFAGTAGGAYSALPAGLTLDAATGAINPSTSAAGAYTVTYTIAAAGGCAVVTATAAVTITALPAATISYAGTPFCKTLGAGQAVTQTGTAGGAYSAAPAGLTLDAVTGAINPGTSTAGIYTVTYTIAAAGGCAVVTATTPVTITALPVATINYAGSPFCKTLGAGQAVTQTGTAGGAYSAAPAGLTIAAVTGAINPSTSTAGAYTVTYTIAAAGGCAVVTTTAAVTITALPTATISYAGSPFCKTLVAGQSVTQTGTAGGTYSAAPAGLTIDAVTGAITPSTSTAGAYTVTYTIAAAGGCAVVTATTPVTITALPVATISYAGSPWCTTAGVQNVTLTGTAGGAYSAAPAGLTIDAATGAITPGTSTAGIYTVSYTIAAAGGCAVVTATTSVTITALPAATISYAGSPFCKTLGAGQAVTRTGTAGGAYSAAPAGLTIDAVTGAINPSTSTAGVYTVTYTIAAAGGCAIVTTTTAITITALPVATINYAGSPFCKTLGAGQPVTQTGTAGGAYSAAPAGLTIDAVTGAINPSTSTAGVYTVTYTIAAAGGCAVVTATATVTITTLLAATISYAGTPFCKTLGAGQAVTLTGTAGGAYSAAPAGLTIDAVTGAINPGTSAAGAYTVTYTIAAAGGCAIVTATAAVTITALPVATISYAGTPFCKTLGAGQAVTQTGTAGGAYSAAPAGLTLDAVTGAINPSTSAAGVYTVTYTIAVAGGCAVVTATTSVTITTLPTAAISYTGSPWCSLSGVQNVTLVGTAGGVYSAAPAGLSIDAATGDITVTASTIGAYTVTYTIAAATGCAVVTATASVAITSTPVLSSSLTPPPICSNTAFSYVPTSATGGTTFNWTRAAIAGITPAGPTTGTNNPNETLVNSNLVPVPVTYVYTLNAGGCNNVQNVVVNVVPLPPTPAIGGGGKTAMCKGTNGQFYSVPLNAGNTYNWSVGPAGTTKAGGGNPADNFIVLNFPNPGVYTLSVQEFTSTPQICGGPIQTLTITVYDNPVADAGLPRTICEGVPTTLGGAPTASGGSGTFTYLWTPSFGLDDATLPNPVATTNATRTYTLNVNDVVSGCATVIKSVVVTVNPLPTVYNVTGPDYYCFGTPGITLTLSGSQIGVNYQLYKDAVIFGAVNPGTGIGLNWSGLTTGTYTVKATNAVTLCTNDMNGSITVAENPDVVINSITPIQPSCFSSTDGVIAISASGGTGALLYSIDNGLTFQSSGTFGSLMQGIYDIIVKDTRGCTKTAVQVLTQPPALSITSITVTTPIACFGNSNGSVRVVVAGGTPGYTYIWYAGPGLTNPIGQTTDQATGLVAGTYWVKITDFNSCTISSNIAVTQPAILAATTAITSNYNGSAISCNGATDGRIAVTASGGTGALSYLLIEQPLNITGAVTGIFTGLAAGSYTVRVTDVNLCNMTTTPVILTQPAAVTASTAITSNYNGSSISCNGATDGRITVTASGGTGALSYLLNEQPLNITGSINGIFTGLGAGSYTVRVRDLNLCTVNTVAVVITAPAAVTASALVTSNYNGSQLSCNGVSDGTITVTAGGGTGALSYLLIQIPGNVTGSASGIFTGVPAGTYTVRVTDLNGCNATTSGVTISNPVAITAPISITSNYNGSRISCFGATDGIITVVGAGGTGALSYTLDQDPANVTGAATGVFTGLAAGTYTVTVKDVNLCSKTSTSVTLNNPPAISALAAVTSNYNGSQVSCNGSLDGSITVMANGGTGALSYLLVEMPLNVTGAATGIFTGVGAGTYTVRVSDLNICNVITAPVTISNPAVIVATALVTSNYNGRDVSCNGSSDGRITVTASGGSGTLTYLLNEIPLNVTGLNTGIFTGVPAGASYTIKVTDKNGCNVNTAPVAIINPPAITATALVTSNYNGSQVSCNGSSDGVITVTAGGGTGALNYSIIQLPGNLTGIATGVFTGIPAGTYTVRVTDINGCNITTAAVTITNPAALTAAGSVTSNHNGSQVSCNGASDGVITVIAGGGTGVRTFVLDQNPGNVTGAASGIFTGLNAATYTVTVTDINGCTKTTGNIVVSNPSAITATTAITSNYNGSAVSCNGALDGRIAVTASGGTGILSYLLVEQPLNVTGAATGIFTGLAAGSYTVRVTDVNLCNMTTAPVTLTQPAAIVASATVTSNYNGSQLSCNTSTDGRITVTASGGTGALSYLLNEQPLNITGSVSGIFTGLGAGSYTVRVRDLNLCTVNTVAVVITAPAALGITVNKLSNFNGRDISCFGAADGRAEAVVTGGTGSYSYNWYSDAAMTISIGQVTAVALNLQAGTYYVRVRDLNNCTTSGNITLTQPVALDASITAQANVTCYGGNTGSVTVAANPATGTAPYEYSINGGGSWSASGTFSTLNASIYNIIARDANGCLKQVPVNITQLAQLNGTVSKTDVSCKDANDGTITVSSPSGGSGIYQYSVDGGSTWVAAGNFSNLVPATYDVRIHDAVNPTCAVTLYPNMVITEPVLLGVTSTGNILLDCNGDLDGMVTFYASGGTLPYNFHGVFNDTGGTPAIQGFNSQTYSNAGAGTITVAVTDLHGCFDQVTINVTQPAPLTPGTIAANQVLCAGSNPAQITEPVPATGGPGAYIYQWQYGSTAVGPFINIAGANGSLYTPPAGANNTLYYRRMITSGICLPVYSNVIEVLVNPKPVAILTGGETICPSQTSILKVNMVVGTPPFEVDIANHGTVLGYISGADIVVSPAGTTTYSLTRVRDANGCEVLSPSANLMGSAVVTVRALPAITVSPVNKTSCEFGMVTFGVTATGSDLTYQWYVNTGSGFNPVVDGGINFGANNSTLSLFGVTRLMNGYIYHVVVSGCSSTLTSADVTLTVNTIPEITLQPKDTTACTAAGANFIITATGTGLTYQWQVNKGTGFNNVVDDANFSGSNLNTLTIINTQAAFNNYIFRIIVSGTCGIPVYSNFAVLRVNIPPTVSLNPVNKAACDGTGPLVFSANGSGLIDSLRWQVFSGGVWSDVHDNAIYSGSTSQQLTLSTVPIALNGNQYRLALKAKCETVNSGSGTLTVNPNPVVNFSAIDPIRACGNVPLPVNGNPTGGSGIWSTHLWTGDIGPLNNYFVQTPTFTSQIAGSYILNYKVKDNKGCFGNGDVTVIVDAPDATFTQDLFNGCTPATVTFTKDMTGIAKFWWDFGDGSPKDSVNANPVHIFTNVNPSSIEYHNVKLTVRSPGGCLDSFTSTVTVYPAINATFTADPAIVCSGNPIFFTTLPGASKYFWDFGDGVSGYFTNTTNHLYTNFTAAPVVLTVSLTTTSFYNCTDVKTLTITVMPVPLPQFTATPVSQVYNAAGNPVTFTNTTNAGTWSWLWDFGDGATSTDQSPTHIYTSLGIFNVQLTVSNANCSDHVNHPVTITPIPPVADFDLIPSGCEPLNIVINNTSLNTNTPGTTYKWDFGDGSTSTAKNPTYTYFDPGTYHIELIVTGPGGTSSKSQVINAYPSPKAYFELSPAIVFVNDEKVRFFNLTQGGDSYLWEFGDGDTSKVKEPFHRYMEEGVFDITLWAYSNNGCSDKYLLSPGVTVETSGVLRFSTVFMPNQSGPIEMDHLPTGGVEIDQFFFPPIREKVINYKLQIFNRLGVLIFESHDINKPWNGYYQNKLCSQGVYVWYVEGKYANGKPFKKVGDVTLLH